MKSDFFPTTLGIEYTVVPANMSVRESSDLYNVFGDWLSNEGKNLERIPCSNEVFKYEEGAWEISSDPLTSFTEVNRFIDAVWNLFSLFEDKYKVRLIANTTYKHKKTGQRIYAEGGGGHLHLGQPEIKSEIDKLFNINFYMEVINHPCLHWVMSEWCDDDILLSTLFHGIQKEWGIKIKKLRGEMLHSLIERHALSSWGQGPVQLRSVPGVAAFKFNQTLPTHELRFFGAPVDYRNLVDNINLAMAMWKRVKETPYYWKMPLTYCSVNHLKKAYEGRYVRSKILNQFYNYIDILGLDRNRYKRYEKNLDWRLKYGNLWTNRLPA